MIRNRKSNATKLCYECSDVESNFICQECQKVYCYSCFNFVHQGKIMKSHKIITPEKCDDVEPWQIGHMQTLISSAVKGIENLEDLQDKSNLYAKENMTHNHDVFTKLHTLLETIQKEHEDKIKDCFLEPLKQAEDIKTQLSEVHRQINLILRETKTMERLEIDYMMEGVPVGVTIDVKYNKNHYKLKDSKIMEDSLRMLFDETLRCEPSITSCDYDIEYYKKYEESDEIVYEESFYDCGFNELSNESTPIKKDPLSGATPKSTTVVTNKSPTIELPFIPRYHIGRKFAGRKSCQARTSIKNVESQIVQIASADSLCAIKYKTDKGSKPEYCSIYNIESLEVSTISFQKDIIRYFLLNKKFQMIVFFEKDSHFRFVDLISQSEPCYSIRELFESLNAFTSKELCSKSENYENCLNFITKEVKEYRNISKKFIPREKFVVLKEFPAKISNIVSPNEFYVINLENDAENQKLLKSFQTYYSKVGNRLPCLYKEGVYGAASVKNIWYRVQIMEKNVSTPQHLITCYFVDDGRIKDVHWNSLKMLAPSFFSWHQMANKCSLANIEPLAKYKHAYTKKVQKTFKDLVQSSMKLTVQYQKEEENIFLITMNIAKNRKKLNVATMLNNFQLTGSLHNGNKETVDKRFKIIPRAADKITPKYDNYRVDVDLLNVVSPDEFYVTFIDLKEDVQKLHDAIQEHIADNEMIENLYQKKKFANTDVMVEKIIDWKVNDHCLIKVRATKNGRRQYYRGIVDEISTGRSECRIFLRDKGTKVSAKCIELQLSTDKFIKSSSAAVLCKLACIYPVNKQEQWSRITIDRFQDFLENFSLFAINQCGHKTPGSNSPLPVILWGIVEDSKVGFTIKPFRKYNNLTDILIHEGLVDFNKNSDWERQNMITVKELRDAPWDLNGWMCENPLEYEEASDKEEEVSETEPEECSDFKIAKNKMRIKSWISASAHNSMFIGTPSYVDKNGFICINNSEEEQTLLQIKQIIGELYNDYKSPYSSMKFVANEPCIARWTNNSFYRGIVDNILDDDNYLVTFVDFGDHTNVKSRDMFHEVIAHNIPILSNRYYVSGIEANDMYGKWSAEALDTLHGLVVDQVCQVSLDDKFYGYGSLMLPKWVKQCSLYIIEKNINVKNFMLENELAVEVKERAHEKSSLDQVEESVFDYKLDVLQPMSVNRMKLKNKNKEFMDIVDSIDVSESVNASTEECRDFMASQSKSSNSFVMDVLQRTLSDDSISNDSKQEDYQSFCNRRAYKKKLFNKPPKKLEELELYSMDLMVFTCEVKCVLTPTYFIVFPLIDEHLESMERLQKFLDEVDPVQLQSVTKPIVNGIYLAKYSEDSKWYRAMVLKDDGELVNVIYVDYMNIENVNVENLRQMPINLFRFKRRGIPVKLFNVKHNQQENRREIKYQLAKLVEGKKLTAVIRDYDNHKIPIIELIDENTNELIYQELINNSILTSLY